MADGYDRFDNNEGSGGGSFVMGLLTGTVLGAGLGMLFAPKAGSELRSQLSEQANKLRDTASETYGQATEKVTQIVDRGREAYDKARGTASRAAEAVSRKAESFGATGTAGSPAGFNPSGGERL